MSDIRYILDLEPHLNEVQISVMYQDRICARYLWKKKMVLAGSVNISSIFSNEFSVELLQLLSVHIWKYKYYLHHDL